jgi:hypothetical protein
MSALGQKRTFVAPIGMCGQGRKRTLGLLDEDKFSN